MSLGDILARLLEENRCTAAPDPLGLRVRPRVEEHEDGSLRVRLPVKVRVVDGVGVNEPPFPKVEMPRFELRSGTWFVGPEGPDFHRRVTQTEKLE